jgi:hypothetical protein
MYSEQNVRKTKRAEAVIGKMNGNRILRRPSYGWEINIEL